VPDSTDPLVRHTLTKSTSDTKVPRANSGITPLPHRWSTFAARRVALASREHRLATFFPRDIFRAMTHVDVLAIAAHRDDIELTCGGTLLTARALGHTTAIIDLSQGETGTRGSAEVRAQEASRAAEILGVAARINLGFPDAAIVNTPDTRIAVAKAVRGFAPTIVIAPSERGRHPDHRVTAELVRDACFIAGLKKIEPSVPAHRPRKVIHCLSFREDYIKPTFVVDISDVFEQKLEAVRQYESQFAGVRQAGEVFPNGEPLYEIVRHQAAHYGSLIRVRYGEPFYTAETMRVDDVTMLEVSTF
jgi:bacillithiol biosynthesis deacetylase BshB1